MPTIRIEALPIDVIIKVTKYKYICSNMGYQYILEGVDVGTREAYKLQIVDGIVFEFMEKLTHNELETHRYEFTVSRHVDEDTQETIIKINDDANWKQLRPKTS